MPTNLAKEAGGQTRLETEEAHSMSCRMELAKATKNSAAVARGARRNWTSHGTRPDYQGGKRLGIRDTTYKNHTNADTLRDAVHTAQEKAVALNGVSQGAAIAAHVSNRVLADVMADVRTPQGRTQTTGQPPTNNDARQPDQFKITSPKDIPQSGRGPW